MTAANTGHRRPVAQRASNLVRPGLRAWLGPRRRRVAILAVPVALVAGFFVASLANRLAWSDAPDLPSTPERIRLAEVIDPGSPLTLRDWEPDNPSNAYDPFATIGGELTARRIDGIVFSSEKSQRVTPRPAELRGRLTQAGWRVLDEYPTGPNDSFTLTAQKDRLVLKVDTGYDVDDDNYLKANVYRSEQPWISAATYAAGLLGTIAGWLIFGWASRRIVGHATATVVSGGAAVLGLLLVTPALLFGLTYLSAFTGDYLASSPVPFWVGLDPTDEFGGLAVPAEVLLVLASAVPAFCRPAQVSKQL